MAVQPLAVWKTTLAALPKVTDSSWAMNFATWYFNQIAAIQPSPSVFTPVGFAFPFPVSLFAAQLQALKPTPSALAGIQGFADAWEVAILATPIVVGSGSAYGPPSPPTIFSVVASTILDPASIAAGKAKIIELVSAPPVANALDSQFPVKFRDATLLLTFTATGMNSLPVPAPLIAANVPLV